MASDIFHDSPGDSAGGGDIFHDSPEAPSAGESFLRGASQGALLNHRDEIVGALESLLDKVRGKPGDLTDNYAKHRDESRAADTEAQQSHGFAYGAGGFVGGLAPFAIPGVGEGGLLAQAGKLGALGAISGAGNARTVEEIPGGSSQGSSWRGSGRRRGCPCRAGVGRHRSPGRALFTGGCRQRVPPRGRVRGLCPEEDHRPRQARRDGRHQPGVPGPPGHRRPHVDQAERGSPGDERRHRGRTGPAGRAGDRFRHRQHAWGQGYPGRADLRGRAPAHEPRQRGARVRGACGCRRGPVEGPGGWCATRHDGRDRLRGPRRR